MDLLYAHFTQLYAALRTLREAKTLYATLRTWQLADDRDSTLLSLELSAVQPLLILKTEIP